MGCVYSKSCIGQEPSSPSVYNSKDYGVDRAIGVTFLSPSSSSVEGEQANQLNQLSMNRESDIGINRLSRVSSQFLPADGSRTVKVPDGGFELKYSYLSQRGFYPEALDKANQDSFCIHAPFGTNPNDHFFGVFDGHGEFGAECSQFVKRKLCENLLGDSWFRTEPIRACHVTFLNTNLQLHSDSLDDSMSGTTAITVLVRGSKLYVANTGDSRAVIAVKRGKDLVAVDLSIDQTPFRVDEFERVRNCGARVLTLDQIEGLKNPNIQCWGTEESDDGDPPRLWVQNGMYPGTAFSRSIGDSIAESIGVVATPEIAVLELTPDHPFFVIASDGVFEFLSSQTVVDMVAKFKDPRDACAAIVAESYRLWLQYETRTDDITIIVVHINGLNDVISVQESPNTGLNAMEQIIEVNPGSESPSLGWNSRNNRARHDVSRARLRAIESSLENGHVWNPPTFSHRKTWEEEAHIERALHDHFLFRKLNDSQRHVLLECMQKIDVQPGEVVVEQGGEGDCFYVVGSGEFEVLASQDDKAEEKDMGRVLHRYTSEKLSCFGELALMYNKPLQASVRAVTAGTLWALKREDFRGILVSEFSKLSSLKLLRSVDMFSRLSVLQLSNIGDALSEVSFSDGQAIVDRSVGLSALYFIKEGQVRLTYDANLMTNPHVYSLHHEQNQSDHECSIVKKEGSYFGEWALLGEHVDSLSAVAIGNVVCAMITKEKFHSSVGVLPKLFQDSGKLKDHSLATENVQSADDNAESLSKVQLSDLECESVVYSTDCSEIVLVRRKGSENLLSLKRFSKQRIRRLGREAQVLKEKDLMKSLSHSACVPQVLCTCADHAYVGVLLNISLTCSLSSILHTPLDEPSARFCAASIVVGLEQLHKNGILYRGVSPDVLMLDQTGHIQFVDFRFGKRQSKERTFTICGMADSLAPEIVQGKGHGFPADWWALGVLIYFMLQAEMPFGSWRESELDTFAKIAKGQLALPQTFSPEVVDIIHKLLDVDASTRLGSDGADSIKSHKWFDGIGWKGITVGGSPVPQDILSRIKLHLENHVEETSMPPPSSSQDDELNTPEWLEDW
ncbi:hypothetical protein AMTRI_Chr05g66950 [Amborella trichopoda]